MNDKIGAEGTQTWSTRPGLAELWFEETDHSIHLGGKGHQVLLGRG